MARQYGAPERLPGQPRSNQYGEDRKDAAPKPKNEDSSPPAGVVTAFHKNAAVDSRAEDIHHTLGYGPTQASPGSHNHNGSDSVLLLEGYTITGSKSNPSTMMPSIIAGLTRLGMKDAST